MPGTFRPDDAVHLIHQFTRGISLWVNNVATACRMAGFAEQKNLIGDTTVKNA